MEIKQKTLLESENGFEQIFEYIRIKILLRTNIRIYSYPKNDTNEYPNKYSDQKYSNIRIYSSHSGVDLLIVDQVNMN